MAILRKEETPLSKLQEWKDNPRSILTKDYERLKKQITDLGIYQPLVVNEDYVVLSGNMRLKAFQELKIDPVWVVVVEAKDKATMTKYALSANDRAGYYEDQQLAELVTDIDINLDDYKIDLGHGISLENLLKQFAPDINEKEVDENLETEHECPKCGYKY